MLKKYAPFISLLGAGLLLFWVLTNQRGSKQQDQITINPVTGGSNSTITAAGEVNRHPNTIIYTKHAKCRMACRHITEDEVKEVLENGKIRSDKINKDQWGTTYPIDGKTAEDKMVRIVVAPKKEDLVLVTVIDLDQDWPCDCK